MAHWDNNLLNISMSKIVSKGKYQVLRRHIEEAMLADWISLAHIFLTRVGQFCFIMVGLFYFILDTQ